MTNTEKYLERLGTPEGALALIRSGDTIAVSTYGNEPVSFMANLHKIGERVENVHLWTMLVMGDYPVMKDDSLKGRRDRAILEVLYATGIKVSELIDANVEDVNFRMGFITCYGESSKTRIIPMGRPARAALEDYVYEVRDQLLEDNKDEKALFVNYYGKRLTRQGLWKILREYGEKSGIKHKLTPNTLRNSFAVHMLQNGADLKSLQELMGHEDIMATQVYLAATKNHIKDVYDKTHPRAK